MSILLKAFASLYVYNCVLFEVAHSYHILTHSHCTLYKES